MSELLKPASFCSAGQLLYLNEDLSDLSLIIQNGSTQFRYPVHALVLSASSSVFRAMLEEIEENENRQITVADMTPSTVELLLRYIYSGNLGVECWTEAIDLLRAAFKYKVNDLVQKCGRFLEDVISLCNVCSIYDKASSCSLPSLQDKCLKLILDAGFKVLRSNSFKLLSKDCVMDVVSSPDLNIDSELVVFHSLLKWARIECCRTGKFVTEANVLNELKPFLQHVCVDDMSDADKSALPTSVLSCVKPNNRNRIGFSVMESLLPYSLRLELEMNPNSLVSIKNVSCLRFSIDSSLSLIGLHFTAVANVMPFDVPLTLVKENSPRTTVLTYNIPSTSWNEGLRENQSWFNSEILLKQPVFLKAGDIYSFSAIAYSIQCPKMTLPINTLKMCDGLVNFSIHGEDIWGITTLIFI